MSDNESRLLRPIIIDFGSNTFRMGFAGDDFPDIVAPSIYVDISDFSFNSDVIDGLEDIFINNNENIEKQLFGNDALKFQNILKVHEFIKEQNYIVLFKYFNHYYKKLDIPSKYQYKQPIVLITPFSMTDVAKNKLQQTFFGLYNFPKILFLPESQSILSTLGMTSGVVVNFGESITYISTIFRGFTNIMARDVFPIAGQELTNGFLNMVLTEKGVGRNLYLDNILVKEIKEKTSICIQDPRNVEKIKNKIKEGEKKYNQLIKFPDGTSIEINSERFMLSEPLFNPRLIHIDYIGLGEAIANVVKTWDRENWQELLSNIVLSGGGSLIPGLKERMLFEISEHFSERLKPSVKVISVSGRENMGWIGASILLSKSQLQKGWVENPDQIN